MALIDSPCWGGVGSFWVADDVGSRRQKDREVLLLAWQELRECGEIFSYMQSSPSQGLQKVPSGYLGQVDFLL